MHRDFWVTSIWLPAASPIVRGQLTYLLPVVAIALGVLVFGETIAVSTLAGIARVLASGPARSTLKRVLATSLSGDVAAALREHGSAAFDEHCCYFRRPH
jgi:drug/metabolite transporter (DMT)-like permease